jgi:hypothetical protein
MEERRNEQEVLEEIKAFVARENFLNYGAIPSETPILDKAIEFSARKSNGHHFRDLITGFFWGYKSAMLTKQDIDRIGELFNICQDKLEKDNAGYADWGVPADVLAQEVLKAFYEEKNS